MTIAALCTKKVVTVSPGASITDVIKAMDEANLGNIIIVEQGKPVGIITDRDVLLRVVVKGLDPSKVKVEEVMTKNPITFTGDMEPAEALETIEIAARRFPVVDAEGKLVGVLSIDDVVSRMARVMAALSKILGKEKPKI